MESSLDKCTTAVFKHGKPTKAKTVFKLNQTVIRNKELDETLIIWTEKKVTVLKTVR
jgi:hypothetical protein